MTDSLRETIRRIADGWELRGRSDRRGKLPPSYRLQRRTGEETEEVSDVQAGPVKRLLSLRWIVETGREGEETLYALTPSGKAEAAKPPAEVPDLPPAGG